MEFEREVNDGVVREDSVICPGCCYQFVAIPVKTQQQLAELNKMYEEKVREVDLLKDHLDRAHAKITEYTKLVDGILNDEVQRH